MEGSGGGPSASGENGTGNFSEEEGSPKETATITVNSRVNDREHGKSRGSGLPDRQILCVMGIGTTVSKPAPSERPR